MKQGIVVPDGHVWLQGDNESNSTDSRHYGPIPEALVTGTVFIKIWPFNDVGYIVDRVEKKKGSVIRIDAKKYQYNQRIKAEEQRVKKIERKEKEKELKKMLLKKKVNVVKEKDDIAEREKEKEAKVEKMMEEDIEEHIENEKVKKIRNLVELDRVEKKMVVGKNEKMVNEIIDESVLKTIGK